MLKNNRCCRDHDKTFLWAQEELNYETPERIRDGGISLYQSTSTPDDSSYNE